MIWSFSFRTKIRTLVLVDAVMRVILQFLGNQLEYVIFNRRPSTTR